MDETRNRTQFKTHGEQLRKLVFFLNGDVSHAISIFKFPMNQITIPNFKNIDRLDNKFINTYMYPLFPFTLLLPS